MALVDETSPETLAAEVALIAGSGEVSFVVLVNEIKNCVDVGMVGRVVVMKESAKVSLEAVGKTNVMIYCIDCVPDGGAVQGVHSIKVVVSPVDVRQI